MADEKKPDDVMEFDCPPPQGNAVDQIKEVVAEAQGQSANAVDDEQVVYDQSTAMEQEEKQEATMPNDRPKPKEVPKAHWWL